MLIVGRALEGNILDNYNREKIIMTFIGTSIVAMAALAFAKALSMFILIGLFWGIRRRVPVSSLYDPRI